MPFKLTAGHFPDDLFQSIMNLEVVFINRLRKIGIILLILQFGEKFGGVFI
jgi:hypothetical protein